MEAVDKAVNLVTEVTWPVGGERYGDPGGFRNDDADCTPRFDPDRHFVAGPARRVLDVELAHIGSQAYYDGVDKATSNVAKYL